MLIFAMLTHHENPQYQGGRPPGIKRSPLKSAVVMVKLFVPVLATVLFKKARMVSWPFSSCQGKAGMVKCSCKCYCACDPTFFKKTPNQLEKHQPLKDSQAVRSKYPSPYTSGLMSAGRPTAKTTTPRPMARYNLTNRTSDSAESANTAYSA